MPKIDPVSNHEWQRRLQNRYDQWDLPTITTAVRKETQDLLREELRIEFLKRLTASDPNFIMVQRQDVQDLGPVWKWEEDLVYEEFGGDSATIISQITSNAEWLRSLKSQADLPIILDALRDETRRFLREEIRVEFIHKLLEIDPQDLLEYRYDLGGVWVWIPGSVKKEFGVTY